MIEIEKNLRDFVNNAAKKFEELKRLTKKEINNFTNNFNKFINKTFKK